jgi:PKD repeat protein
MKSVDGFLSVLAFMAVSLSCQEQHSAFENDALVVADFEYSMIGDCSSAQLEVELKNSSQNAESYLWDFGDGTTSDEVNAKKVYARCGKYTIRLTAFSYQDTTEIEKEIFIFRNSDNRAPSANLSFTRTNLNNLECAFEVTASGSSYLLSFGDGQSVVSHEDTIIHQYSGRGTYTAELTVENLEGCSCATVILDLTL